MLSNFLFSLTRCYYKTYRMMIFTELSDNKFIGCSPIVWIVLTFYSCEFIKILSIAAERKS
jgi:hypothetical protein